MTKITAVFLSLLLLHSTSLLAQNVGIGTTTPANKLSVVGKMDITDSLGIGTTTPAGELHVKSAIISGSTIDQQQTIATGGTIGTVNWQSFTAGTTVVLTRVDLEVSSPIYGSSSPGTIKIFMGEGNTGTVLSTTSVTFQPEPVITTFQSFTLSSFPAVIAGNKYTIEFSAPAQNAAWVNYSNSNPYSGGRANFSPTGDYLFKTYVASEVDGLVVADGKAKVANLQIPYGASNDFILKSDSSGNASWVNSNTIAVTETDPKVGTLANNKIPKWNGTNLADGLLFDNGTNLGIGTTTPVNKLSVNGKVNISDSLGIGTTTPAGELHVKSAILSTSIIDQQQTIFDAGRGQELQWQSFTAGATGVLTRVDLGVRSPISGSTSPGTIKIFMGEGNTGTALSTTAVTFQPFITPFQSFTLGSFPAVIAGNKYTIEFSAPAQNVAWVNYSNFNPYSGGRANVSSTGDYLFKTYVAEVADGLVVTDGKAKVAKLQIPNGATNGFVLKSDASGNASWVNANTVETDPKIGTLTSNKIPKWNGTTLADGLVFDDGTNVGIGTTAPAAKLHVASSGTGLRIDAPPTQTAFSIGGAGSVKVDAIGVEGGRLLINDNGNMGIGNTNPITTLDVNGGIRTKYSGTVVVDVVGGAVRTLAITIPALPADWNVGNTIVTVVNADGVDGIVRQARLTSPTNIDVKYIQDINGLARFNWVIFKM